MLRLTLDINKEKHFSQEIFESDAYLIRLKYLRS